MGVVVYLGRVVAPALYAVAAVAVGMWLFLTVFPPVLQLEIPAAEIKPEVGQAFISSKLQAPYPWLLHFQGDEGAGPGRSRLSHLRLFEDGKELGPAHGAYGPVREEGHGRFYHFFDHVLFSSSDGSDPRTNGRRYVISDIAGPSGRLSWFAGLMLIAALLTNYRLARLGLRPSSRIVAALTAMRPSPPIEGTRWNPILAVTVSLLGIAILIRDWLIAKALNFAYAGWLPISDSSGWWNCGKALEHASFANGYHLDDWCRWRPLYPAMLGSVSALLGGDTLWLLLAQAALLGLAAYWFLREAARLTGIAGAALATLLIFSYADDIAIGQMMTENGGLIFGMTGLALMLRGADAGSRSMLALGVAGLSVGLTARAGALFVLPLLLLWSGFLAQRRHIPVWSMIAAVALAAASGPVLQSLHVLAAGGTLTSSGGNFSFTLYGLVTGGRDFEAVKIDHPEIGTMNATAQTSEIYRLAWAAFTEHPSLLLQGLQLGLDDWRKALMDTAPSWALAPLQWVVLPAGILALVWRGREPGVQMLALVFVGEALSAPWIAHDGGVRVFAATKAADMLIAALGLQLLARIATSLVDWRGSWPQRLPAPGFARAPSAMLLILLFLVAAPVLRLPGLVVPRSPKPPECGQGLTGFAFDLDRGFIVQNTPPGGRLEPLVAAPDDLIAEQARFGNTWWAEIFKPHPPDGTARMLFSTADLGIASGGAAHLLWKEAPPLHRGDRLELCVDRSAGKVNPFQGNMLPVVSGRVIAPGTGQ